MRAMKRTEGKWVRETPENLSAWLWKNDGEEAVVVDDKNQTYYCGTPTQMEVYRAKWEEERRVGDQRKAAMFIDLDRQLFAAEC